MTPTCCPNGIAGSGSTESGVVFVGIAPGATEVARGTVFVGPSGKLLNGVLDAVGVPRSTVYCTNLIHWYKDDPTPEEIAHCMPFLQQELQGLKPTIVVALGALATSALFGYKLGHARGAVLRNPIKWLPDTPYGMCTYHPAAAFHRGDGATGPTLQITAAYSIIRDLAKLQGILHEPQPQPATKQQYHVVYTPDEAQLVLNKLANANKPIVLDVETSYDKESDKAHPFSDTLLCVGVGAVDSEFAYVFTQKALQNLHWPTTCRWVYHNGAFDTQQLKRHLHVDLPISDDTMLMSYTIDERSDRGTHKLKSLAREFAGGDFYEEEEHHADLPSLYEYNSKDVIYTQRLYNKLKPWIQEDGVTHYEGLLLPAASMLARSQTRGIYIDQDAANIINVTFGVEYFSLQKEFEGINPDSPIQVREYLRVHSFPAIQSTNKFVLQDLLDNYPDNEFIQKLLRYRTLAKMITTYLLPIQHHIKFDGRVHPHAFLIGTVTGRLTYKDPPMQTLPKKKTVKDLAIIGRLFAATNDDYVLVEVDYAQIEAWIAAHFSGDPILLSDLESGNWHTRTTEDVFGIRKADVDQNTWLFYYDGGKHLNYGCLFEEGPEGLTRRPPIGLGCDIQTARAYHRRWYERYHVFDGWRQQIKAQAVRDGFLGTPFGRKRRFPIVVNDHQRRQMVNAPIQSTASDYTLSSAIRLEHPLRKLGTHLLFLEHDAGYWEIPRKHLQEALSVIRTTMESPPLPGLPSIKVETTVGPNLYDMMEYKEE